MKNWGKFFILVLMILAMTACGEKGGGSGGSSGLVNDHNWDELIYMADDSNYSIKFNSEIELETLYEKLTNSGQKTEVRNLIDELKNIRASIYSKTLEEAKSVDFIKTETHRLVNNVLFTKTYSELLIFQESFRVAIGTTTPNSPYQLLTLEEQNKIKNLYDNLNLTLSNINKGKSQNSFYSEIHHLYYESNNLRIEEALLLKIGIDYNEIDITNSIAKRKYNLNNELILLEKLKTESVIDDSFYNTLSFYLTDSSQGLLNTYNNYLPGKESDVSFSEMNFRLYEQSLLGRSEVVNHKDIINQIISKKELLTNTTSKTMIINILNEYVNKENHYNTTYGDFEVVVSYSLLIEDTYYKLKRFSEIQSELGIIMP